jgi:exonuclease III
MIFSRCSQPAQQFLLSLTIAAALMAIANDNSFGQNSQSMNINVMSLNVWSADSQTAKLREIIQAGQADIIGLQEMDSSTNGMALANALGFRYFQQGHRGNAILSRYPIVGRSADNRGVNVEISPGHTAWVYNAHLTSFPYGPYDLRDNPNLSEASLIATANQYRQAESTGYINTINANASAQDRVFWTGDFNEPSHLDWTTAAAAATPRTFDKRVQWPTSERVVNAGFSDSFRTIRPNEVTDLGYTWTPGYPPPSLTSNEVHDRIDFVYYRGAGVSVLSSNTIGPPNSIYGASFNPELHSDIGITGYNTDHRAVASAFRVNGLSGSKLTFAGLIHNPGNSNALNQGNYGDRLLTSQNTVVQFAASAGAHWDTYDGNQDSGGPNNWEWGVAQLQSPGSNSGAQFDLTFTSDAGFGVVLNSFELVDYANFAAGHTVRWELWAGLPNSGSLLTGNIETFAANSIRTVFTNFSGGAGIMTLRLIHLSGDGTDLAINNVSFQSIPEPGTAFFLSLFALSFLKRNRKSIIMPKVRGS